LDPKYYEMRKSYDMIVNEYYTRSLKLRPDKELNSFINLLNPGAFILDLGCGPGRDASIFIKKNIKE